MKSYSQDYVDESRRAVESQVRTYDDMVTVVRDQAGTDATKVDEAVETFESQVFADIEKKYV